MTESGDAGIMEHYLPSGNTIAPTIYAHCRLGQEGPAVIGADPCYLYHSTMRRKYDTGVSFTSSQLATFLSPQLHTRPPTWDIPTLMKPPWGFLAAVGNDVG
jgi:hypothetical protein